MNKKPIITPIYKEALLEVDNLRNVAEEDAKKAILEAMTPIVKKEIDKSMKSAGKSFLFEEDDYDFGTRKILEYLKENKPEETVLAGGDVIAASNKCNITFSHMSTGGGATLEYLEGKEFKTLNKLNGTL
jgi:phosphoglycerate kinase